MLAAMAFGELWHWLLIAIGILVGLAVLVWLCLIVFFLALHWITKMFCSVANLAVASPDFGTLCDQQYDRQIFPKTGTLPMSSVLVGAAYRWHHPNRFWRGTEFWRSFEDGPWKWAAQQRYAGKNTNAGHYFSLVPGGATAEAGYYGMDTSQLLLLKVDGEVPTVLDLTYEENLFDLAKIMFRNLEALDDERFFMQLLSFLVDPAQGGNKVSDYIGHWAVAHEYDGILFFGARALHAYPDLMYQIEHGNDSAIGLDKVGEHFQAMRARPDLMNLVILSGSTVIRHVHTFELPAGSTAEVNPYYHWSEEALDKILSAYGTESDRQAQLERQRFTLDGPELQK